MIVWKDRLPWPIINQCAAAHGLDPDLIAAFIMTESSGNPGATRFEPKWRYFYRPEAMEPEEADSEKVKQATSWGLMQVMGSVARELGYQGDLVDLAQPQIGLEYGCLKLATLMHKYALHDAISSYNAGSPRQDGTGNYVNQKYVNTVLGYLDELKAEIV